MNSREAIRLCIDQGDSISKMYLSDLTDADLLVRPVPGCNHIAWQLGHCLAAEHMFVEALRPGCMPALPNGFADKFSKETSGNDDAAAFQTKQQFLDLYAQVHSATLTALETFTDAELDNPPPERMAGYTRSVGDVLSLIGTHWTMHAGQWAVIRRKLGKPPIF